MDGVLDSQEHNLLEVDDTFGLEFAAVQWLNLVTNAEELFNKLLHSILLSGDEKEQIQRWLCLKQECEECVASDETTSFGEHHRHSLERIEELTEDTEEISDAKSSDSQYESDSESDFDSHHPDFEVKLDGYMERFKDKTDMLIRSKLTRDETCDDEDDGLNRSSLYTASSVTPVYQKGRRKSLHPGDMQVLMSLIEGRAGSEVEEMHLGRLETKMNDIGLLVQHPPTLLESSADNQGHSTEVDRKRSQIRQIEVDIEGALKRVEEFQHTIKIKQQFIKELMKNSETRASAKSKFQKKWRKLEEEYYKTRTQLAQAERTLHEARLEGAHEAFVVQQKTEIEKCRNLARHYEKRLKDIDMIKQIAGDSGRKVLELEGSLLESKKQLESLKKQLKKDENRKKTLEQELKRDQKKNRALEEKNILPVVEKKEDEELSETMIQKRKQSKCQEKLENKFENGAIAEKDEKEELRQEIRNLRKTRDCLLDQRSVLDEKYQKDSSLSLVENRTRLECDEAIEAIDAAIEFKNELICGRKSIDVEEQIRREQGEQMLMIHLRQLSADEMRTHLYKYFQKVIDLKDSGKKMEEQLYQVEHENENLTHALMVADRQVVALQREHQEKLHLMLRHFAEESGSSGTETGRHLVVAKDSELSKYKRDNKQLRRRVQELEALIKTAGNRGIRQIRSRSVSPDPAPLKQLPAPPSTTKITLEKNKVILRLNAPKKKSTNKDVLSVQQSQMVRVLKKS